MFRDLLGIKAAEDKFLGRFNHSFLVGDDGVSGGGGFTDDTEADDPNVVDSDNDVDFSELLTDDDSVEDDAEGDDTGEEDVKPDANKKEPDVKPEKPAEKMYTKAELQAEIDRVLADRLARERAKLDADKQAEKRQAQAEAEAKTYWSEMQTDQEKYFVNLGFDEAEAKKLAVKEVKREQRIARLEQQNAQLAQQVEVTGKSTGYDRQKQAVLSGNPQLVPYANMYAAEIDAFSQNGAVVDFETAMNFIIGQKFASGELLKKVKTTAEQKTLANVNGRKKLNVEGANLPGGKVAEQVVLTPFQEKFAAGTGLSRKDMVSAVSEQQKMKKKRGR